MTAPGPATRVWVVPTIFALVVLSMPVQIYVATTAGEPYPGLFQPAFSSVPDQEGKAFRHRAIELTVDGRPIEEEDLLPGLNPGRRKQLLLGLFPVHQVDAAQVDDETRTRFRSRLAARLDTEPQVLVATWNRVKFKPDTRETTVIKKLSQYRIDLTGVDG